MTDSKQKSLQEKLDAINRYFIALSSDNLLELTDCLLKIENLSQNLEEESLQNELEILKATENIFEFLISGKINNTQKALDLINQSLVLIQNSLLGRNSDHTDLLSDILSYLENEKQAFPQEINVFSHQYEQVLPKDVDLAAFKKEFVLIIEKIQTLLIKLESKEEREIFVKLADCYKVLIGAFTLIDVMPMVKLAGYSADIIEYAIKDQLVYSEYLTDILLKASGFLLEGINSLEIKTQQQEKKWQLLNDFSSQEMHEFIEKLWEAKYGLPNDADAESSQAIISGASKVKSKKLGEILLDKGLISNDELTQVIEDQAAAKQIKLGELILDEGLINQDDLNAALLEQSKEPNLKLGDVLVKLGKITYDDIDRIMLKQGEARDAKLGEFILKSKMGEPEKLVEALREQKNLEHQVSTGGAHTVKVETLKLDGLINLVGELVIAQSLISSSHVIKDIKEQKLTKDLAQVLRITSDLQRNAMSLRMVQLKQLFQKVSRLVRDLSHKFQKDVNFEIIGEDTEIDRGIVESLYEPLLHMIRNALDHGLESNEERAASLKPAKGYLCLKAFHQSGNVIIQLQDDGRGLDKEKVLQKAIDQGLISGKEKLSDQAIHNLVFLPGFSTADKVSDISGRGVGMDIVKNSIEKMRGKVEFESTPGEGSLFTIKLPLTLAIIDGMIVRVGESRYILPTISIYESFRPAVEDFFTVKHQGEMIKVRDSLLPLVRLDKIVGVQGAIKNPSEALVVVVENEKEKRCLLVDEVLGKQEVVIKSLGDCLKHVKSLAGGTILGDGQVGLILDINGLFNSYEGSAFVSASLGGNMGSDWDMENDESFGG